MKITPLDIRRKEFKRSVRGYSDEEVDIFLDEVADEFERIFQENMELHDRMSRMDEQIAGHAQLKDALEKTLISAQLQAEELRSNAHKESELILRDAEMKARGIVSDSYGETQKTQQTLVQLKLLEEDFRFKFRSLLEGYLRLLSQAPLASAGSDASALPETRSPKPETAPPAAPMLAPASDVARAPLATSAPAAPVGVAASAQPSAAPLARPVALESEQVPLQPAPGGPAGLSPKPAETASPVPPAQMAPRAPIPPVQGAPVAAVTPATPTMPVALAPLIPAAPSATGIVPAPPVPMRFDPTATASSAPTAPPAPRPVETQRPVEPRFDDDSPTQEVDTAETSLVDGTLPADGASGQEPLRRFFFGRQMSDVDDTFQSDDANTRDRNRDFEW